jgi:hypothetical protein
VAAVRIFVSYRWDDVANAAGRLADHLGMRFRRDRIFFDTQSIAPGRTFESRVFPALQSATIVLAVIGPKWRGGRRRGHRIEDEDDWVRRELAYALAHDKLVIPVLIETSAIPKAEQLPPSLRPLSGRRAHALRHASWHEDCKALVDAVGRAFYHTRTTKTARRPHVPSAGGVIAMPAIAQAITALDWSPDGRWLAASHGAGEIRVAEMAGRVARSTHVRWLIGGHVHDLRWSPKNRTLAAAGSNRTLVLAGPQNNRPMHVQLPVHDLSSVAWCPTGDRVAGGSYDGRAIIFSMADRAVRVLDGEGPAGAGPRREVYCVVWRGPEQVAGGCDDGKVLTWDSDGRAAVIAAHESVVTAIDWSPQRRRLASCGADHAVLVSDHRGGIVRLESDDVPMAVRWDPSGTSLAVAFADGTVGVWDGASARLRWRARAHPFSCSSIAWSSSGGFLATGGDDGAVRVWEPDR